MPGPDVLTVRVPALGPSVSGRPRSGLHQLEERLVHAPGHAGQLRRPLRRVGAGVIVQADATTHPLRQPAHWTALWHQDDRVVAGAERGEPLAAGSDDLETSARPPMLQPGDGGLEHGRVTDVQQVIATVLECYAKPS